MNIVSHRETPAFSNIPKGRLSIWILVFGEIVIFGGAILVFILYYFRYPKIFSQLASLTSTPIGALNTVILLSSSFFAVKAHYYAAEKKVAHMGLMMWLTVLFGCIFMVFKSLEWIPKIMHGINIGIQNKLLQEIMGPGVIFWSCYYFLTGLHAFHIIIGMISIIWIWYTVKGGKNLHRVEMIGIYWHFVDIIWIFLFPTFYLS